MKNVIITISFSLFNSLFLQGGYKYSDYKLEDKEKVYVKLPEQQATELGFSNEDFIQENIL